MKIKLLIVPVLILFAFNVIAQNRIKTYTINSLEGVPEKVSVIDGGLASAELSIGFKKNKITVISYWALNKITVIKNKFIKIQYAVRGGSGLGIEYVILLCVSHDKLIAPINLMSMFSYSGADEDDMYTLKFDITGLDVSQFKMNVRIHDKKDIRDPKLGKSYDKHSSFILHFDSQNAIFFNGSKTINGRFITGYTESEKPISQTIKGTFSMIHVNGIEGKGNEYYYINACWHEQGQKNYLIKNTTN
jgi:hypothetical protein